MSKAERTGSGFYLNKWFLDFIGDNGMVMIFYATELSWKGITVPYKSWLSSKQGHQIHHTSGFRRVEMPTMMEDLIQWGDSGFGVSGVWKSNAKPLYARLIKSDQGNLDWNCFLPHSTVSLNINDQVLKGVGYVEQLEMTILPWEIPMDQLRWGHFNSDQDYLVWIEIVKEKKSQWVWWNGQRMDNCDIEDHLLHSPAHDMELELDMGRVLESEKKISNVVKSLTKYIPGFSRIVPTRFLLADEIKWYSKGLLRNDTEEKYGSSIHEYVNFNITM